MKKFCFGLFLTILILPIVNDVGALIDSLTQLETHKIAKKIHIIKKEIRELQEDEQNVSTNCIGFQINNDEEEEEE